MPQDGRPKHQSERHFINQSFEGAETAIGLRKAGVRPSPEMPMAEAAVVALDAEAERIAPENSTVEADFSGENGVGMRRARKADPAFVAQRNPEIGAVTQIPRQPVAADFQDSAAAGIFDAVGTGFQKERTATLAHLQRLAEETPG